MTTATQPRVTAEMLRDRWRTLTIGVDLTDGSETNSASWQRLDAAIRTLGGRMVHGVDPYTEYTALCQLEARIPRLIEEEVLAFALAIETDREAPEPVR